MCTFKTKLENKKTTFYKQICYFQYYFLITRIILVYQAFSDRSCRERNCWLYRYVTRTNVPFLDLNTRLGLDQGTKNETFQRVT